MEKQVLRPDTDEIQQYLLVGPGPNSWYYKSGDRSFIYRYLPFWLASLVSRLLIVIVPLFVVIIPSLRYLPLLYRWRIDSRIHHRYGELMELERQTRGHAFCPQEAPRNRGPAAGAQPPNQPDRLGWRDAHRHLRLN